jgi:hypothetical protein
MPIRHRKDFDAERLNKCPKELHNKLRNPRCRMESYEKEPFNPINPPKPSPQPTPSNQLHQVLKTPPSKSFNLFLLFLFLILILV